MTIRIQQKRSAVKGKVPLPTDLEYGEIAVNYEATDPGLYLKDSADAVRKIGGDASTTAKGMVQLADAAAVTAGTAGMVVDAKGLKDSQVFLQDGTDAKPRTYLSKLKDVVSVKDFGAVCDGVTNDAAAVSAANTAAAGRPLSFPGVTHIGSPVTITSPIVDTLQQLFTANSQITIDNKLPVRPDWWGDVENTLNYATNALPAKGGTVKLAQKTYKDNNHFYTYGLPNTVNYLSKDNVLYDGEKMPALANDCKSLVDGSGTIIQGMVAAFANNIEFKNLGIDSGKTHSDAKFGGMPPVSHGEGLYLTYPDDARKAASAQRTGVKLHNIIALLRDHTQPGHAILLEGLDDVKATGELTGVYGYYGCVFKSSNVSVFRATGYMNGLTGIIIKTDLQASAIARTIQIAQIHCDSQGPEFYAPYIKPTGIAMIGLHFAADGNYIDGVQIGRAEIYNYQYGVAPYIGPGKSLSTLQISSLRADCNNLAASVGVLFKVGTGATIQFLQFGEVQVRRATIGAALSCDNPEAFNITSLAGVNISDVLLELGSTCGANISSLNGYGITNALVRITGAPKPRIGNFAVSPPASVPLLDPGRGGLVPALINGWAYSAPNDLFVLELSGGMFHLRGLLLPTPGSTTTLTILPEYARPIHPKRFVVQGYNGVGNPVAVPLAIYPAGSVLVNETDGGLANCSTWLSLNGVSWSIG
jgi:hypothetical protein